MRSLCAVMSLFLLTLFCTAQTGIEGKWSCSSEDLKHTKLDWTLTITRSGDRLTILMEGGRDNDRFSLEKVKFLADTYTAMITLNPPDDTVSFRMKLEGDSLNGGFEGKNSGTGPFLCKRNSIAP